MWVIRDREPTPIKVPGFIQQAKLFERLAAVEICRRVCGVTLNQGAELRHRFLKSARICVFHGEPVASKGTGRILLQ